MRLTSQFHRSFVHSLVAGFALLLEFSIVLFVGLALEAQFVESALTAANSCRLSRLLYPDIRESWSQLL